LTACPVVAVGAVIVVERAILLVRRGRPPAAGLWAVPGGRVNRNETLAAAVVREVREETSLAVTEVGELAYHVDVIDTEHHYVILDFYATVAPGAPVAADDAAAVGWFGAEALRGLPLVQTMQPLLVQLGLATSP